MNWRMKTFIVSAVVVSFLASILSTYLEAREFNRCSGGNATLLTAMFTQLRVDSCRQ